MDAPELAHADSAGEYLGREAASHNAELLQAGPVLLETDVDERDDYGRLLAYVWAGDVFVNVQMVRDGYARAHDYPPNLAHQDELWQANDSACEAGIGIWSKK
jgi:micrococcal nuclease